MISYVDYTVQEYIGMCTKTALYPEEVAAPYLALGFCSEASELQDAEGREYIKELGDCQWYMCRLATHLGFDFEDLVYDGALVNEARDLTYLAGMVAGHIKKQLRDGSKWNGEQREEVRQKIRALIVEAVARSSMEGVRRGYVYVGVLKHNADKLLSRQERGTLQGSGDNR